MSILRVITSVKNSRVLVLWYMFSHKPTYVDEDQTETFKEKKMLSVYLGAEYQI